MNLQALLNPRSIAVVGASDRPSAGRNILISLQRFGYCGNVYPVNPKREQILGHPCFGNLADIPGPIDVVAFCIGNAHLPTAYRAAADKGVKAAAIYAGGFSESSAPEAYRLGASIRQMSLDAGIALCGPNCMGTFSPATRSTTYLHELLDPAAATGNVGVISQSGAICIALASDCRRFGFSHMISSGNESVLTTCDFLEFLIADQQTRVIGLFLESVREPDRFVALLDAAAVAGKPVVVLKVGKSERARHSIVTHTGGLAGESAILSAVLAAHRAIEVDDLTELTEVLAACQGRHWPRGERLAIMTGSGGQAELILDIASCSGLNLPPLQAEERSEVELVVGHITGDGNPLDAWGSGDPNTNYPHALNVLGASSNYDAVALLSDGMDGHPLDEPSEDLVYSHMVADAASKSQTPFYFLSTRAGVFRTDQERILRPAGVALVSGVREGLGAIRKLARWSVPLLATRTTAQPPSDIPTGRVTLNEYDSKALLARAGLCVAKEKLITTLAQAQAALAAIGGTVALKVVSDDIAHKSEYGLVELGIDSAAAFEAAWNRIQARIPLVPGTPKIAGVLVQAMVQDGIEVFAGVKRDPDFGLVLAFGLGGVLVEITRDVTLRPLPLRAGDAEAMIDETAIASELLAGVRGNGPSDLAALAANLYAVADFAWANCDKIDEIDVNPIKVLPQGRGCIAVDALIVPRCATGEAAHATAAPAST